MLLLIGFILALIFTGLLRRYAIKKNIIDVPVARSSHSIPTPRGGGVAIVVAYLLCLVALYINQTLDFSLLLAFSVSGFGIALLGFLDDHGHLAARWRLLGHLAAAVWFLYWSKGAPAIDIFGLSVATGIILNTIAVLFIVWSLNLYNFMDGIDGLASVEAITVCLAGVIFYSLLGHTFAMLLPLTLAACVAGFLCWNFPPAKIFMGDAGSGFLGFILATLTLYAASIEPQLFWSWIIMLGVFVVDATFTLMRRFLRGEKVYEAHRSHAYQFASRYYKSHKTVTLAVLAINIGWLFPIAALVALQWINGALACLIAYAPLLMVALKFEGGKREQSV